MNRPLLFLAIALFLVLSPCTADEIRPTHHEAAEELLRQMDVEKAMMSGVEEMVDIMTQQNPGLIRFREVIVEWAANFLTWETIGPRMVQLYAEAFTEQELRDLSAFYETPTGRKVLVLMPELMSKGMALGAEVAEENAAELDRMIQKRAAELESEGAEQ